MQLCVSLQRRSTVVCICIESAIRILATTRVLVFQDAKNTGALLICSSVIRITQLLCSPNN